MKKWRKEMIPRYTLPEMAKIWSRKARFEAWYEVELAWLQTLEDNGDVPKGATEKCKGAKINLEKLDEIEKKVRHEVIAFLEMLREQLPPEGKYIHHGLTSSDIMDTGVAIQTKSANEILLKSLDKYIENLLWIAEKTINIPSAGRTHGMHAEPIAFGLRFARFAAAAKRDRKKLKEAMRNNAVGKLAGAVGTYAFYSPDYEQSTLSQVGLNPETVPSQVVSRDRHAELLTTIAVCASNVEQFAIEMRHLQRTEVSEAEEPFTTGQKGSSAMPHKRNPIVGERLTGLARLLRGLSQTAMENVALWHERDISHSSTERFLLPTATATLQYMLERAAIVAKGLNVYEKNIERNMNQGGGILFTQAALLKMVEKGLSREDAYSIIQELAFKAKEGGNFKELLKADKRVNVLLNEEDINKIFATDKYLKYSSEILKRVKE
tara:strand:+ start:1685 stop:2992 length:1308 start_codon:yes stop_codon:yes gene_type:complete